MISPFHLAIPCPNIQQGKDFYCNIIGCSTGREAKHWLDLNFFGHQLVLHLDETLPKTPIHNPVDGDNVPVPHFGVVLTWQDWQNLAERLQDHNISFIIEPRVRFQGKTGEQGTFFFHDPFGNALEFKTFKNIDQLFANNSKL